MRGRILSIYKLWVDVEDVRRTVSGGEKEYDELGRQIVLSHSDIQFLLSEKGSIPSLPGCDSQGPLLSGGATCAQSLDDEDGAYYDAPKANSQPQGTDHGLCQL